MAKKKSRKHLQFYMDCMTNEIMPHNGLCRCAQKGLISENILELFKPDSFYAQFTYWASGEDCDFEYSLTPLRQTIVLLMACLNNEL